MSDFGDNIIGDYDEYDQDPSDFNMDDGESMMNLNNQEIENKNRRVKNTKNQKFQKNDQKSKPNGLISHLKGTSGTAPTWYCRHSRKS